MLGQVSKSSVGILRQAAAMNKGHKKTELFWVVREVGYGCYAMRCYAMSGEKILDAADIVQWLLGVYVQETRVQNQTTRTSETRREGESEERVR